MKIASLLLELHIGHAQNLKAKRQVVRSLKERIQSRFNASVSEVGHQDSWQRCQLGICICTETHQSASKILVALEDFCRKHPNCSTTTASKQIADFEGEESDYGAMHEPNFDYYSDLFENSENNPLED